MIVFVKSIQKTSDFTKIHNIRIRIFSTELGLSKKDIFDNDDKNLEQFLIMKDNVPVGTFRLREINDSYKIERMGILSEYRFQGFGKFALEEIKSCAKKIKKSKLILDSIYDVRAFYANSGFVEVGDVYGKVGIPHVKMNFKLE